MPEATVASRTNSITCPLPASLRSRPRPASQVCFCKEPLLYRGRGGAPPPPQGHTPNFAGPQEGWESRFSSLCLEGLGGGGGERQEGKRQKEKGS